VIVLGGGNTAWTAAARRAAWARRTVKVIVRSTFADMKASPWEKEDAQHEGIPIIDCHVPKAFVHEDGKLVGMRFENGALGLRRQGPRARWSPPASPSGLACDEVLVAVGQENAFPWIERD
jgi:NADPH-dependent glutamate synthase beta subunit-like oxidoreductase